MRHVARLTVGGSILAGFAFAPQLAFPALVAVLLVVAAYLIGVLILDGWPTP